MTSLRKNLSETIKREAPSSELLETKTKIFKELISALEIKPVTRCIALVGAGGKTSLMFKLAKNMLERGQTVISTTSTKIYPPSPNQSQCLLLLGDDFLTGLKQITSKLQHHRHITLGLKIDSITGKVLGLKPEQISSLLSLADHVIVEADGASGRPIKAPNESEPVVPDFVDLVIPIIGLDSVFLPATKENVFRLEEFLHITNLDPGIKITPFEIELLFDHPNGGLRNIPETAKITIFLNKLDMIKDPEIVCELAQRILRVRSARIRSVVTGILMSKQNKFTRFNRVDDSN